MKRGFLGRRLVPLLDLGGGEARGPLPEARPTPTQRKRIGKAPSYLKTKPEGRNLPPSLPIMITAHSFCRFVYSCNAFNQKKPLFYFGGMKEEKTE